MWQLGQYDEAIRHYREMLRLNPGDNQGIRYILASCLAELGRYDDLEKHLNSKEYKDDCAPDWCYTKALVSFVKNGASKEANRQLATAMEYNPYVPAYLTGKKRIPEILSDMVSMGGEDEAYCYAHGILSAWIKVPGAIEWLKEQTGLTRDDGPGDIKQTTPRVGRNAPCPCGSGKKYKQCCGK